MNYWTPWVAAGDIHGDLQDKPANDALFKFIKVWKPEIRVCLGDIFDLRPLRRKASEEERRESLKLDVEMGTQWLESFKPTHTLLGNHDHRLWDMAARKTGPLSDKAEDCINEILGLLRKVGSKAPLPYDKRLGVLDIGNLRFIHGYGVGITCARRMAQIYGSVLMGHLHAIDIVSVEGLERRVARVIGCLCQLDMEYNRTLVSSLRQQHGWAYGVLNKRTGSYYTWQAENVNGKWLLPTKVKEF